MLTRFQGRINGGAARPRGPGGAAGAAAAGLVATLAVVVVLAAIAALCLTRSTDPDLPWRLETGRLIRATGEVPDSDPFSYTAYGLPWVDNEWLFQAGALRLHEAGGPAAVTIAVAILVAGLFAFLHRRCRAAAPAGGAGAAGVATTASAAAAIVLLAALAAHERFLPRPEVAGWWLLAAVMAGLDTALGAATAARRRIVLWVALPLVAVAGVNLTALFILGPVMTLLALVAGLAEPVAPAAAAAHGTTPAAGSRWERAADLLLSLALQAGAALLNPHGARAIRVPFERFAAQQGGGSLLATILPERRPTLSSDLATPAFAAFAILALLTAVALVVRPRRGRLFDALAAGAAFYLALRARGDLPIFAIVAAPILARAGGEALAAMRARCALAGARAAPAATMDAPPAMPAAADGAGAGRAGIAAGALVVVAALVVAGAAATNRLNALGRGDRWFGIGAIPCYFPEEAAEFVARAALPGQVFHPLAAGGFLVRAWGGDRRVFIDGREEPYQYGVLETYLRAVADPQAFEAAASKYQITAVLWPHQRAREGEALLKWLAAGHGWVLIHLDPGAAVYARQDVVPPGSPAGAEQPGARPAAEMRGYLTQRLAEQPFAGPPIRERALADFFGITGDPEGEAFFRRAAGGGGAPGW